MSNTLEGKKFHFIYKTTNLLNGKFYYGMHSTSNLKDGYLGSGKKLRRSINKHGIENFKIEILEFLPDRESLATREKELITEKLLNDPMCMNLKIGGEGGFSKEVHLQGAIASNKKQKELRETNLDWVLHKANACSLAKKGIIPWSAINAFGFKGKKHSEETKQQMKKTRELNKPGSGEKNSQFGTCWIHNLELKENKKIKKEYLDFYLHNNWTKGRKIKI